MPEDVANTIQALWIGDRLSSMEQTSIRSFLAQGYNFHLYTYGPLEGVPPGTELLDANAVLPPVAINRYQTGAGRGSLAGFANIFRYKLLYEKGGAFIDLDLVCLKRIGLEREYIFTSERVREGGTRAGMGYLKVPRGAPVMADCYETAVALVEPRYGELGPKLLDRKIREHGLEEFLEPAAFAAPVPWWQFEILSEPHGAELPAETHAVHLWHEMWRRRDGESRMRRFFPFLPPAKDRLAPAGSIYGELQRRFAQ